MDALDDLPFLQLGLGNAADAHRAEVGVTRLDAAKAAKVFVTLGENETVLNGWLSLGLEVWVRILRA